MRHAPDEITRDQVLAYGEARGLTITSDQLIRWHRDGLLPRPRRVPLGRGKGTVSVYPVAAAPQALALALARQRHRDLDLMAWSVWLDGFPLTSRVRSSLLRSLDDDIQLARELHEALTGANQVEDDEASDPGIQLVRESTTTFSHVPVRFRSTSYRAFAELLLGTFEGEARYNETSDAPIIAKGLRVGDLVGGGDVQEILTSIAPALSLPAARTAIAEMSDVKLEALRDDLLRVWRFLETERGQPLPTVQPHQFIQFIGAVHVHPLARVYWRWLRRTARTLGYATFEEALSTAKLMGGSENESG